MHDDGLPSSHAVCRLVGDLVGRTTTADRNGEALALGDVALVAEYADQDGAQVALALCDAGFANRVGAALTTASGSLAEEATHTGRVSALLRESTEEVLNVLAALLTTEERPVRLRAVHGAPAARSLAEAAWAAALARRDVAMDVAGYGPCRVALLLV